MFSKDEQTSQDSSQSSIEAVGTLSEFHSLAYNAVFASWNVQFSKTCHSRGFHIVVHWSLVTPKAHFFAPLAKPLWFNHTHLEPGSSAGWLAVGCVNQWCFPSIQRVAKIRENEMMTVKAVWPTPNTRASRGAMSFPATRYTAATAAPDTGHMTTQIHEDKLWCRLEKFYSESLWMLGSFYAVAEVSWVVTRRLLSVKSACCRDVAEAEYYPS